MGGFDSFMVDDLDYLDNREMFQQSYSPPALKYGPGFTNSLRSITNYREVNDREISEANLKLMPGFRLSWYYTGNVFKPDPLLDFPIWKKSHKQSKFNKDFNREANY